MQLEVGKKYRVRHQSTPVLVVYLMRDKAEALVVNDDESAVNLSWNMFTEEYIEPRRIWIAKAWLDTNLTAIFDAGMVTPTVTTQYPGKYKVNHGVEYVMFQELRS